MCVLERERKREREDVLKERSGHTCCFVPLLLPTLGSVASDTTTSMTSAISLCQEVADQSSTLKWPSLFSCPIRKVVNFVKFLSFHKNFKPKEAHQATLKE